MTCLELVRQGRLRLRHLIDAGASIAELRAAGLSATQLFMVDVTPGQMREAEFPLSELLVMGGVGFTARQLRAAGFSLSELLAAGVSARRLREAGYSARELYAARFSADHLRAAGFTDEQVRKAGLSLDELAAGIVVDSA